MILSSSKIFRCVKTSVARRFYRIIVLFVTVCSIPNPRAFADEGMWLPLLLDQLVIDDMQSNGLKLSAEDIYSVNSSSLKDAVLLFGTGCTGEVISGEGLVLTNHHCGFGQIQSHSSTEHDYITNGFWAMNKQEELVCPGLSVTFIIRIDDVTARSLNGVSDTMREEVRQMRIAANNKAIEEEAVKGTHYGAMVKPFYYGNQYYVFITETFKDIRLVGAPPQSIGNFGGDEDNWIWPRHNADFSLFRIYSGPGNVPAEYSPDNVPFKPRYFFPVSMKGVKEGDFTMVYGFPGKTTEYISSYGVDLIQNVSDPEKVAIRDIRLGIWWEAMKQSDSVRIQYASKYYGLSNAWKKWQGEIIGLKKAEAIMSKQEYEQEFTRRIESNAAWKAEYGNILPSMKLAHDTLTRLQPVFDYYTEALLTPEVFKLGTFLKPLADLSSHKEVDEKEMQALIEKIKKQVSGFFKNYDAGTDETMTAAMLDLYARNAGAELTPIILQEEIKKYSGDYAKLSQQLFSNSFLDNQEQLTAFLNSYKKGSEKKLLKDPAYQIATSVTDYFNSFISPPYLVISDRINLLNRKYMKAQMEVMKEKTFYPDANLTLRIAYGKVAGYHPRNAVTYNYQTTIDGVVEKYIPGDEFYDAPQRLIELYNKKDFGDYADASGKLYTCFVASNHTTGGNSGSPVINAEGQLIGINFDRCWEGTMSDIYYDPEICRNIAVDIRYTLFIIDRFAGAGYLLKEMSLVR